MEEGDSVNEISEFENSCVHVPVTPPGNDNDGGVKEKQQKRWLITHNNYTDENLDTYRSIFKRSKYVIGFEKAPTTGTPHIHIYVHHKTEYSKLLAKLPKGHGKVLFCTGQAVKGYNYCIKDGTFEDHMTLKWAQDWDATNMGNKYRKQSSKKKLVSNWEAYKAFMRNGFADPNLFKVRPFQKEIIERVNEFHRKCWLSPTKPLDLQANRHVYWYFEETGNVGKSTVAKYMRVHQQHVLKLDHLSYDNVQAEALKVFESMDPEKMAEPVIVLVDLCRAQLNSVCYSAIESLASGDGTSGKYEGGNWGIPNAIIICFANVPPKLDKFSEDRWHVFHIGDDWVSKRLCIEDVSNLRW